MTREVSLKNCGFCKSILMLLVILGHSCAFWSGNWFTENPAIASTGLNLLHSWLNSFHIYCFALISGYIFAYKMLNGGYSKYFVFLKTKCKRLLIPYVFVALLWVIPISAYFFHWDYKQLIKTYFLCINPSQLWFLWMLFGIFAMIWPLWEILNKNIFLGWVIALLAYFCGIIGNTILPNVFCIWTALQYFPFFYIGIRLRIKAEHGENYITKIQWYYWMFANLIFFGVSIILSEVSGGIWTFLLIFTSFFLHMTGSFMAWTVLHTIANNVQWETSQIIKMLSIYSMPMYLFHQQIIYFVIAELNGEVNPWINASINFIVALIGSFAISWILMKWKVTRFLIGEK